MVGHTVQIKSTSYEPSDFHGAKGCVIRETSHGYMVVRTIDNREIIIHPKSLIIVNAA